MSSDDTVRKYLGAIVEVHLFYHADRYDIGGKKVFTTKGKYYAMDLGMRSMLVNANELRDMSAPLENAVYFELLRKATGCSWEASAIRRWTSLR